MDINKVFGLLLKITIVCGFLKYSNHCSSSRNFHCLFVKKLACLPLASECDFALNISLNKNRELEALLPATYREFDLFSK